METQEEERDAVHTHEQINKRTPNKQINNNK